MYGFEDSSKLIVTVLFPVILGYRFMVLGMVPYDKSGQVWFWRKWKKTQREKSFKVWLWKENQISNWPVLELPTITQCLCDISGLSGVAWCSRKRMNNLFKTPEEDPAEAFFTRYSVLIMSIFICLLHLPLYKSSMVPLYIILCVDKYMKRMCNKKNPKWHWIMQMHCGSGKISGSYMKQLTAGTLA